MASTGEVELQERVADLENSISGDSLTPHHGLHYLSFLSFLPELRRLTKLSSFSHTHTHDQVVR